MLSRSFLQPILCFWQNTFFTIAIVIAHALPFLVVLIITESYFQVIDWLQHWRIQAQLQLPQESNITALLIQQLNKLMWVHVEYKFYVGVAKFSFSANPCRWGEGSSFQPLILPLFYENNRKFIKIEGVIQVEVQLKWLCSAIQLL